MKIIVVCISLLFFTGLSFSQDENNAIQNALINFLSKGEIENAAVSFLAYDIDSNQVLASYNHNMSIPAASTVKLFTTAAALEILGKDYQPKTEIYQTGTIDSLGVLHGDIIIRGLGDASLGSRYFYEKEEVNLFLEDWVNTIKEKGIKKIEGKVLADGSAFGYNGNPDGWAWSDMGNYYGTGPSACAVYDNTTFLHFSTSNQLNGPTYLDSMTPPIPGYELHNQVTTYNSSSDNAYIYGAPYSYQRFAIGNLPRNRKNFEVKASVPDPELLLAQTLQDALIKEDIPISSAAMGLRSMLLEKNIELPYKDMELLLSYNGKSVQELAHWTNLRSVNLFAEQLLCLIGYEKTGKGSTKESAKYINNYWTPRLGMKTFQTDGSGLSRSNGFSAEHMVKLLEYMYKSDNFEAFESTLAIAGESGTLRSVSRNQAAHGKMKAKSGSMNKIRSYAGYIDAKSGRKIAFAVIVNNFEYSNIQLLRQLETLFNTMTNF